MSFIKSWWPHANDRTLHFVLVTPTKQRVEEATSSQKKIMILEGRFVEVCESMSGREKYG